MFDTDTDWQKWAKRDPHFAVLTDKKFKDRGAREEFLASGAIAVAKAIDVLETAFGQLTRQRALDFGCGVGRLTVPLASRFDQVVGVDVSPVMLAEARANCDLLGFRNVDLVRSDDILSGATGEFDLILSLITLQHIPVKRGMTVIASMLARLARGGAIYIDVSVAHHRPEWLRWLIYHGLQILPFLRFGAPPTQMNVYPLAKVVKLFHAHGIDLILVCYADHDGVLVAGLGGRRPGGANTTLPSDAS